MQKINGKLISKSFIQTGTGQFGEWKKIDFTITKIFDKKKYTIPFQANGRLAELLNNIQLGERITIRYIPVGIFSELKTKWWCNNKAIEIEKWTPKKKFVFEVNGQKQNSDIEIEFAPDNQLPFKTTKE